MANDYSLSMTGSVLRKGDTILTARIYLETGDWLQTRHQVLEQNEYQLNTESSIKRISGEIIKRLKNLTDDELRFLVNAYGDDQLAMLWVAICRTYPFVSGLSRNVIVDRYSRMVPNLTIGAYEAFFDEEAEFHPELNNLSEKSKTRMRNQILQITTECRLVSEDGRITPLYPSPAFTSALSSEHREDLMLFPGVRLS